MGVNVTTIAIDKKREVNFPCLMKSTRTPLTVLFVSAHCGTVIIAGDNDIEFPIGLYYTGWTSAQHEEYWEHSQAVTISND